MMIIDRRKTIHGALAGAMAASVWGAQIPLDKKLFASDFDDIELLGKAFTRGRTWRILGWALHIQNGAIFGGLYANLAPRMPVPSWARGPLVALVENFATWPLAALSDRLHPARDEMPALFSSPRALAQSTWRHALFGVLLGELERQLNAEETVQMPPSEHVMSTNGHHSSEHVLSMGPKPRLS